MGKFGFEPVLNDTADEAEGYMGVRVHLGDHAETFASWAKLWSLDHYLQHWHEAAAALLAGDECVLFCTDYATTSCSCFVGWSDSDGFVFEEWVIKHEDISRDGFRLKYLGEGGDPTANASRFRVSKADVETFTR